MGLFDFLKKKKEPKEPISMEEYIKIRKDEGVSDDDIKEEIDDIFCFDLDDDEGHGVVYTTRKFKSETHY